MPCKSNICNSNIFFHNHKLWGSTIDFTVADYQLHRLFSIASDGTTVYYNAIRKERYPLCPADDRKVYKDQFFGSMRDILYFSCGPENKLFKMSVDKKITTFSEFRFTGEKMNCSENFSVNQKMLGNKWLIVNYYYKDKSYSFLYDHDLAKSYNCEGSVIKDDLLGTSGIGFRTLHPMNDGMFCFVISSNFTGNEIKATNSGLTLVIMKVF